MKTILQRIPALMSLLAALLLPMAAVRGQVSAQYYTGNGFGDSGSSVVQGSDGLWYGTTAGNINYIYGTIYKVAADGTSTTLHVFNKTDGNYPAGSLLAASDGSFYGVTTYGGANGGGAVFKITSDGTYTLLHSFDFSSDGQYPVAGLVEAADGFFYGTTAETFYKIASDGTFTSLHTFTSAEGNGLQGPLVQAGSGDFYGTAESGGGDQQYGTFYRVTTAGVVTVLHNFNSAGSTGIAPQAGVVLASDGNVYGTTAYGGTNNGGTVFEYTAAGAFTTLYTFTPFDNGGINPQRSLVQAPDGYLYGVNTGGSSNGLQTIFRLPLGGTPAPVYTFVADASGIGAVSTALAVGSDGNLYGRTEVNSRHGIGSLYRFSTSDSSVSLLHGFTAQDGSTPAGSLIQTSSGSFYGVAQYGGSVLGPNGVSGWGTVFRLSPNLQTLTTIHNFTSTEGHNPVGPLVYGKDKNFWGTTPSGGTSTYYGTIFRMTSAGSLTTFHNFADGSVSGDGKHPNSLTLAEDGSFYGTTKDGGANSNGTAFKISSSGGYSLLHSFSASVDGSTPSALIQALDGNFYGTTFGGGSHGNGTVFQMTSAGVVNPLWNFAAAASPAQGASPVAALVQGKDYYLYGTTEFGGAHAAGTLFRVSTAGALSTLYSFDAAAPMAGPSQPTFPLIQAKDGNLYGATSLGGYYNEGTMYQFILPSTFTKFYDLGQYYYQAFPSGTLLQGSSGMFYGVTSGGPGAISDYTVTTYGVLQFGNSPYTVDEAAGSATITVTRKGGSSGAVSVQYTTKDGSGKTGTDYTKTSGTLSWSDGDMAAKTFSIPILDRHLTAGPKTVQLTLSAPTGGAALGSPYTAKLTINDDDGG